MELDKLIEKYKSFNHIDSKETLDKQKIDFVYHSNRLEGSNLTLAQTEDVINYHKTNGEVKLEDMLMAIDHHKALNESIAFGANKYPLSNNLLLQIHTQLLKNTFEISSEYFSWKNKGQKLGELKVSPNRIKITENGKETYFQTPSPEESKNFISQAISFHNKSTESFLEKTTKLMQNIYNAHPFFDGNKRMTRLIFANRLIANELPLITPHKDKYVYNDALVQGLKKGSHQDLKNIIEIEIKNHLQKEIQQLENTKKPKKRKGLGFIL